MRYRALSDVRVVDLTHFIAGPYATKLLADMGADVVKVEPPWGDGGRKLGPHRAADEDRGGLFAFLNLNKLGVTLNLKHERGRELLAGLLDDADLLIENFAPGTLAALGVAPDELIAKFPKLSVVSISNFGQDGPERDGKLNDLVLFARGGWTFPVGEPNREPLTPPGSLAQYVAALYGAIAAMQALAARDLGRGHGQHIDVSILEATVATMIYETVTFQYTGILAQPRGQALRGRSVLDRHAEMQRRIRGPALCDRQTVRRAVRSDGAARACFRSAVQHRAEPDAQQRRTA